ncbi:phosphopentomutase [bacterium]|nr:MAG: phosphopentomutase [bacterium]
MFRPTFPTPKERRASRGNWEANSGPAGFQTPLRRLPTTSVSTVSTKFGASVLATPMSPARRRIPVIGERLLPREESFSAGSPELNLSTALSLKLSSMKRAIVIVLDGCGAGAAPDAAAFGDPNEPSTLRHVFEHTSFVAPTLERVGLLAAAGIPGPVPTLGRWGRLAPLSQGGKDSVTGHWEMMGIVMDERFPTYPDGFPPEVIRPFEAAIGRKVIGNKAASGTAIIDELGEEHVRTGSPILYTSADSVFQIATHESVVPIEELYRMCEIARGITSVQRVIARPFEGEAGGWRRTERRRDFPLTPPPNLIDEIGDVRGIGVVPELFGGRGFRPGPRTQSNVEHEKALFEELENGDARFVFANFEDFDMLYGHRNDPAGFAGCLERFDGTLSRILDLLSPDDLLILTADHGNDPTDASTDHSREYIPFVTVGDGPAGPRGDAEGFAHVGEAVKAWLA